MKFYNKLKATKSPAAAVAAFRRWCQQHSGGGVPRVVAKHSAGGDSIPAAEIAFQQRHLGS